MFVDARHVRLHPGRAVRVHAAALRLVPDPDLLDLRARAGGRSALAQILVAVATALLVYEIGRRFLSPRAGLVAAAIATLNPYLVWHDVHVNREIVDQLAARRRSCCSRSLVVERPLAAARGAARRRLRARDPRQHAPRLRCRSSAPATSPGACRARARPLLVAALVLAGAAVAVAPWVVRNKVQRRLLRDHDRRARAVEGEQPAHLRPARARASGSTTSAGTRRARRRPGSSRPRRRTASGSAQRTKRCTRTSASRCASTSTSRSSTGAQHPGDKAKLAALSAKLLWQPNVFETSDRQRRRHAARRRPPGGRARVHVGALRARRCRPLPRAARVRRARAAAARATRRRRRWSSSARRATGSRGTSCSRSSPPATIEHVIAAVAHTMRVMHVHRIRGIGGSERHLLTLLPALAERGIEPVLVGLDDPDWDAADFYGALRVPSVRVRSPRDLDPLLLARLVRELRADVVHTHLVHADVYGGVAAKLRGSRLVSTKHNDDPFRARPVPLRRARPRAPRGRAWSRSPTRCAASRSSEVGIPAAKVETIHYGLDEPAGAVGRQRARRGSRRCADRCSRCRA